MLWDMYSIKTCFSFNWKWRRVLQQEQCLRSLTIFSPLIEVTGKTLGHFYRVELQLFFDSLTHDAILTRLKSFTDGSPWAVVFPWPSPLYVEDDSICLSRFLHSISPSGPFINANESRLVLWRPALSSHVFPESKCLNDEAQKNSFFKKKKKYTVLWPFVLLFVAFLISKVK